MTNFEILQSAFKENLITKQDIYDQVISGKITQEEYTLICNEECPELSLDILKQQKKSDLWKKCNESILSGFYSSASGEELFYGNDEMDQSNLQGMRAMLEDVQEPIVWKLKGIMQFVQLTRIQFQQLCIDGKLHRENNMQKYFMLCTFIEDSTTKEELDNINW